MRGFDVLSIAGMTTDATNFKNADWYRDTL